MALPDLFLLAAFVIFLIAIVITAVRAKAIDWTGIGLALFVLALIVGRGIV